MFGLAALILAAASANASPALTATAPWWERFVFTMTDDDSQQVCQYETSLPDASQGCGDEEQPASAQKTGNGPAGPFTKITVERRFTPIDKPDPFKMDAGDTLLGGQIMALAIDESGTVQTCEVIGATGEMKPPYGCDQVRTERFEASAAQAQLGFMTVLVYGHEEYPV